MAERLVGEAAAPPVEGRTTRYERRSRTPGPRSAVWPAVASLLLALAAAISAGRAIPVPTLAALLAALVVLTAAGAGLWSWAVPAAGRVQAVVAGVPLGLALAGLGVVVSGYTGLFWIRWLLPLPALAAWLVVLRRPRAAIRPGGMGWGLWGVVPAQAALLLALRDHLATVPAASDGWRAYYVDVPWHITFTAEALDRAPSVYPWVPDVSLGYTWFFSAALGGWGSATPVTAADLIVRIAPALFAVLVPLLVAGLTWTVSRSRLATVVAPVLLVLAQGPLFIFRDTMDITPLWLIPNRDFSDVLVLLTVAVGIAVPVRPAGPGRLAGPLRGSGPAATVLLCFLSFAASAAKGSALPVLLGAFGILVPYVLLTRRPVLPHLVRLVAVGAGMLVAQYTVTKSLSYLTVSPFSFLAGQTPPALADVLPVVVVALLVGSLLFVLLTVLPVPALAVRALPLVGGGIAGVSATAVFGHPGLSQLYFLHAAWPLLCIGVAVALARWATATRGASLVTFAVSAAAFALVLRPPAEGRTRDWGLATLVVLAALAAASLAPVLARLGRAPRLPALPACAAGLLAACFVVQNWGFPGIALPVSTASSAADPAAVSADQRAAYAVLKAASAPYDLVMTNKHCLSGSVGSGNCDPRWFGISAFAERRVLVEGWSYTRLSEGVPREDRYWRPGLLARNDAFLADPDATGCAEFVRAGVDWIYVDKREPWSDRLGRVAEPVFDSPSAVVYRLEPGCSTG